MLYCFVCRLSRNWPGGITTSHGTCQSCGAQDRDLYDYPTELLPGTPHEVNSVAEREDK
jgi:hypothetical protein